MTKKLLAVLPEQTCDNVPICRFHSQTHIHLHLHQVVDFIVTNGHITIII